VKRVPTGCQSFDDLLGGGIEKGSVTLLYGEAGAGKSNVCLQIARNVISEGKKVAYIDSEGLSYDRIDQIFGNGDLAKGLLIFQFTASKNNQTEWIRSPRSPQMFWVL
jgi:RecA/RadA recombinase